ncbi:hypothetical protein KIL84_002268 [Mauremys mutica]|uniref:Uncharacterized protein n=1 Tax=Mauremys mutica TaxID=74926 RepID=A0A9D3X5B0_9SAUR|nr:hypothetical protein KIL84_002268 [Mauremys mutica]
MEADQQILGAFRCQNQPFLEFASILCPHKPCRSPNQPLLDITRSTASKADNVLPRKVSMQPLRRETSCHRTLGIQEISQLFNSKLSFDVKDHSIENVSIETPTQKMLPRAGQTKFSSLPSPLCRAVRAVGCTKQFVPVGGRSQPQPRGRAPACC